MIYYCKCIFIIVIKLVHYLKCNWCSNFSESFAIFIIQRSILTFDRLWNHRRQQGENDGARGLAARQRAQQEPHSRSSRSSAPPSNATRPNSHKRKSENRNDFGCSTHAVCLQARQTIEQTEKRSAASPGIMPDGLAGTAGGPPAARLTACLLNSPTCGFRINLAQWLPFPHLYPAPTRPDTGKNDIYIRCRRNSPECS